MIRPAGASEYFGLIGHKVVGPLGLIGHLKSAVLRSFERCPFKINDAITSKEPKKTCQI
jgi:hypothetical protein